MGAFSNPKLKIIREKFTKFKENFRQIKGNFGKYTILFLEELFYAKIPSNYLAMRMRYIMIICKGVEN